MLKRNTWQKLFMALFVLKMMAVGKKTTRLMVAPLALLMLLGLPPAIQAKNAPEVILQLARGQPDKAEMVRYVWQRFDKVAEHYAKSHGLSAVEALYTDPAAAVYAMEVFPGYFQRLSEKLDASESVRLIKSTFYRPEFLNELNLEIVSKYKTKPRLLGLIVRSDSRAKEHLFTDLETKSPELPLRFIDAFTQVNSVVRQNIILKPDASFFLLETEESGVQALREYGSEIIDVASFYQPGHRKEVVRELKKGGNLLLAAYREASIIGWKTATQFPELYRRLARSLGVAKSVHFLNANSQYLMTQCQDPSNPHWVSSVVFQVESLHREGLLPYTEIDPFGFALCMESPNGKELMGKMGSYLPASLLCQYYPRHKVYLSRFLSRYGVVPLKVLYEYSQDKNRRLKIERLIDKCGSKGLLLLSYTYDQDRTMRLLLEEGMERGEEYLKDFRFDSYGIPSLHGKKSGVPELVKISVNYFYYNSKPTWEELGIAALDVVDILETAMTWGATPPVLNKGGKLIMGKFVKQYAKSSAKSLAYDKVKKIARKIVIQAIKRVIRKELVARKLILLDKPTVKATAQRVGKNFAKTTLNSIYRVALSEFLQWAF